MEHKKNRIFQTITAVILLLLMTSGLFTLSVSADYSEQTIIVSEDGQTVDSFCGIDAKYIYGYSDTGDYCCAAYVSKFYSEMFGVTVYNINMVDDKPSVYCWGKKCELRTVTTPKPGDIMQNKDYTHVGIVKECNNGEVTLIEQNYKWWWNYDMYTVINRKIIQNKHYYYRLYIDGVEQTVDTTSPTVSAMKTSSVSGEGYTVSANISDDKKVTKAIVTTYTKSNKSDKKTVTITNPSEKFSVKIKTADFGKPDGNYFTTITAYDAMGNSYSKSVTTYVDTTAPSISGGKGSEITAKGYKFSVDVKDSAGISKVEIPAWTAENSSDDKVYYYPTNNANTYTIKVPTSDHKGDTGLYRMKVKVWDNYNNYTYKVYEVTINPATDVKLSNNSLTMKELEIKTVQAEMVGEHVTDQISWKSNDKSVATVSNGKITAVSVGKTNVVASTTGGISKNCAVKVTAPISNAKVSMEESIKLSGDEAKPLVTITYNGEKLVENTDYTLSYSSNSFVGTGKVKINGKGCYTGSIEKNFSITPSDVNNVTLEKTAPTSLSFTWDKSFGADGYIVYKYNDAKKKWTRYDEISTNSYTDLKLDNSHRYRYKIKAYGLVGKTMIYGKATSEVSFVTKPGRTYATASSKKAGTITFNWDWVPAVHGYEIWISPNGKAGTYEKVADVKKVLGKEKYTYTVKGLKSGKLRYVKVRAYRTVDGINLNGQCSEVKTIFVR